MFLFVITLGIIHTLIHELGHIFMSYALGMKVKRVGIHWAGVYVVRERSIVMMNNIYVALAGPAANLITFAVMFAFHAPYSWVPLYIGMFNLIPISRSDMSKAIQYYKEFKRLEN